MLRALQLAARGRGMTGSNPMVGAVIVAPDGRVIGEGWHRRYGQGHAEVNAVSSVKDSDRELLPKSTIYVTLEPCSHYGKTPPCARLLVECGFPRVVVGAGDPNPKVNGRGVAMLREGGAEVVTGILADESEALNYVFFTAYRHRRPFVILKWAQSADGFMDCCREPHCTPQRFSNALTSLLTMKLRGETGAVITTASTAVADNCRLTLRGWSGDAPRRFVIDRHGILPPDCALLSDADAVGAATVLGEYGTINELWRLLFDTYGVTSVLVEAGPRFLKAVLDDGAWDALRVEIAPFALGASGRCPAPELPCASLVSDTEVGGNRLLWFGNNPLFVADRGICVKPC